MIKNFNPPQTNQTLDQFFDFETDYQSSFCKIKDLVLLKYPSLKIILKYHVPFFLPNSNFKGAFYFHYFKNKNSKKLFGEISFVDGYRMFDLHSLFVFKKTARVRSILVPIKITSKFIKQLENYIEQNIEENL
jgi:hypothetical protein